MTLELDLKNISIKLPGKWIMALESLVECGLFNNRSEAIREGIRMLFAQYRPLLLSVFANNDLNEKELEQLFVKFGRRRLNWWMIPKLINLGYEIILSKRRIVIKKDGNIIEINYDGEHYEVKRNGEHICVKSNKYIALKRAFEYIIWNK